MYILLGVILLSSIIYLYLLKPNKYWRNKSVKYEKPTILFGNMLNLTLQRVNFIECIGNIYNKYSNERYVGIFQFTQPILLVRDLELVKRIAIKDSDSFVDHQAFSREDIDPLWSRVLFASKGEAWHQMRVALSPSFTSSKMKMMYGLITDCADQFVQYFVEKDMGKVQEIEFKNVFTRFTNDAIATCAFGVSCDSLREPNNEFYTKGIDATDFKGIKGLKFFIYPLSPALMKLFKIKIINDDVGNFFREIIKETIRIREEQNIVRPDMIQLMMELRKKVGDELSIEDMTAQALIFFLAGFESASILMSFIAYELALNPAMQDRLKQEIDDTLKANNGKIDYDALMSMKYLDMFVNETLRKWPPTPMTDRVLTKDNYTIKPERPGEIPVTLQKGDTAWFPIFAMHRDPKYFQNPDKFDPERFSDKNKHRIQNAFLPFGLGPRNCIGSRFVLMENKAIMVRLLQEFEIVPVAKTNIPMKLCKKQFSTYSADGWWLGLKRRST